jgi:hypothetical protein
METDVKKKIRKTKSRWEDYIRNNTKKLKIRIGLAAFRIAMILKHMFRRPKHSTIEVVAPKKKKRKFKRKSSEIKRATFHIEPETVRYKKEFNKSFYAYK